MDSLRIVVVGGVAGGASAAARARRCNANAEITLLEKGPTVSFANCGLPYHIGGEIKERERLLVASPELFWNRLRVRVRTEHEVTVIDREARTVAGMTSQGAEFREPYDRLILATGSEPLTPPFLDTQADNVFQLWTLNDMDRILAYMQQRPCKQAVVVGAGYVGLEVVEQLKRRQIEIVLIERLPQVLATLDIELARLVEGELRRNDIRLNLSTEVASLLTDGHRVTAVKLANGESVATDLVIASLGVRPRVALAQSAGLELGETGGVKINAYCQTSDEQIYAVGDIAEYFHGSFGRNTRVPLAGPANRSGRVAGTHAVLGRAKPMSSVHGTSIVRVFGTAAGATGLNQRQCESAGLPFRSAIIRAPHHASYFPGAQSMTLKLIYQPESGKLLGAQAVGAQGVDKRLDVVATVLHFGGTVYDLAGLDLAYAPPFGSAKDPLHMAAFVAENDLAGFPSLSQYDMPLAGQQVLDVRDAAELAQLPLAGAVHIPLDELAERWQELDADVPTVAVCHSGKHAHVAACWLSGKGFASVTNLSGGMFIRSLTE